MSFQTISRIIAFCLLLTLLSPISAFSQQRAIVNPSLEEPIIADNSYSLLDEDSVPGWDTSHPVNGSNIRPIEMWRQPFNGVSAASGSGSQWAELNANTNSMIYQTICMSPGESFTFSFLHRGRYSSTERDVMDFRLGIPTGLPSGSVAADSYSYQILQVGTTNNGTYDTPTGNATGVTATSAGNGWMRYAGTYTYPITAATQQVHIGFRAVSSSGGISLGNFIDDWQINLAPYFENSASSSSDLEGTNGNNSSVTPENRPAVRIGGTVSAPVTFRLTVTGGTATIGNDYSLSIPFLAGNETTTADVTVPAGTYDGTTTGIFKFPFAVHSERFLEPDETVTYTITKVSGPGVNTSLSCQPSPIINSTYTILNDDTIPTAAGSELSGRVIDRYGRGASAAMVTIIMPGGETLSGVTNPFGYFRFPDVASGRTYILNATAKSRGSATKLITVNDSVTDLEIDLH